MALLHHAPGHHSHAQHMRSMDAADALPRSPCKVGLKNCRSWGAGLGVAGPVENTASPVHKGRLE